MAKQEKSQLRENIVDWWDSAKPASVGIGGNTELNPYLFYLPLPFVVYQLSWTKFYIWVGIQLGFLLLDKLGFTPMSLLILIRRMIAGKNRYASSKLTRKRRMSNVR